MMRQCLVMRHAKSSWEEPGQTDHERPLNRRGRQAAVDMATHLARIDAVPELVIASDARRTMETSQLICQVWQLSSVIYTRSFYLAGAREICEQLQVQPAELRRLLVLGHNFGWEEAVHWFTGETVTLKTGSCAILESSATSWAESVSGPQRWSLQQLLHPRDLER